MDKKRLKSIKLDRDHMNCLHCGGEFLHQEKVEVFKRKEYEKYGIYASIEDTNVNVDTNSDLVSTDNPSQYRDGVLIELQCESCQEKSKLAIFQHKGCTYFFTFLVDE